MIYSRGKLGAEIPKSPSGRSSDAFFAAASTTHRYISTLVEVGVLERDPASRHYRLPRKG
jgi:hypothetical protein